LIGDNASATATATLNISNVNGTAITMINDTHRKLKTKKSTKEKQNNSELSLAI